MDLTKVQVAPFGPKLGQNDARTSGSFSKPSRAQKHFFRIKSTRKLLQGGGGRGRIPLGFAAPPKGSRA